MKKGLKKTIAVLLAAASILSMSACSDKKTVSKNTDDENETYEIIWYYVGEEGEDLKKVNDKVNEYLKEKINATLVMNPLDWGPFYTKMQNISSAGEKYDLRWINSSDYQTAVSKGAFLELDELLEEYAPKTKALLGDDYITGAQIDNTLYAIPANKDAATSNTLYCRKDIVDKYNMDFSEVKSFKDMWPFFEIIAKNEPDMYAYQMSGSATPWDFSGYDAIGGNGVVGFVPGQEDEVVNLYETALFEESVATARDMYNKGFIYKDCATEDGSATTMRKQGKIFSYTDSGHPGKLAEVNASENYEYVAVPINEPIMSTSSCEGSMMAIPYDCENPARVMKFVELLNTDEYLNNLINYGIEGVHYDKIADNRIKMREDAKYGSVSMQWVYGNTFINYLNENDAEDKFEKLKEYNETAKRSQYLGFVPDMEAVRVELSACTNVLSEYKRNLTYGTVDAEDVMPSFRDKLKKAGIDTVREEVQKQYDEWKNAK